MGGEGESLGNLSTPVGISLTEWRDRVVTGISLMGTNCGWSR